MIVENDDISILPSYLWNIEIFMYLLKGELFLEGCGGIVLTSKNIAEPVLTSSRQTKEHYSTMYYIFMV